MLRSILTLFLYSLATFPTGADTLVSREQRPVALVREDGTVWVEERDGETLTGLIGTRVPELEEIIFVSAGARHFLALDKTGRVWAWGDNQAGQLGDGGTRANAKPKPVAGLQDIVGIAAGDWHSLAVDGSGGVWAWGSDSLGQLGSGQVGAFRYRTAPIPVSGLPPLRALAAGTAYSAALAVDGTSWGWGGLPERLAGGTPAIPVLLPAGSFAALRANTPQSVTALSGRVGDANRGLALAMIAANGRPCGKSDATGAYLCVVPRGWRGTLTASLSGHRFSSRRIDRTPARLDFTPLPNSPTITGLVRDAAGKAGIRPALGKVGKVEKAGEIPKGRGFITPALQKPPAVPAQVGKAGETPALQKPPAAPAQVGKAGETPTLQKPPAAPAQVEKAGETPTLQKPPVAVAVPEATAPLTLEGTISLTGGLFGQAQGLAGVRIVGKGAHCAATDAQGRFTCQVTAGWSGHLAPMKRHYRFSPGSFTYRQLHSDMAQQDFAASYEPE